MPGRSDRFEELHEASPEGELPYISKSRVVSWFKNPEHFRLKYLEGYGAKETEAMDRGTRIHETFEHYYREAMENPDVALRAPQTCLPSSRKKWAPFIEPHVSNFMLWEHSRFEQAKLYSDDVEEAYGNWLPLSVEEEHWLDDREPPWSGLADAILPAASIREMQRNEGAVIVDFKTGKVPRQQYRDEGIHLELAYYEELFEDKYDIAGSAAYYPSKNEVVTLPEDARGKMRGRVGRAVEEMVEHTASYDGEHFPTKPGPLCKWGPGDDEESEFYGICPCSWGVPVDNQERFEDMLDEGLPYSVIAERLGTTADAVGYWKYKLDS